MKRRIAIELHRASRLARRAAQRVHDEDNAEWNVLALLRPAVGARTGEQK